MNITAQTLPDNASARGNAEGTSDKPVPTESLKPMFKLCHLIDSFATNQKLMVKAGVCAPTTARWYSDQFKKLSALSEFPAESVRTHHLAAIDLSNAFVRALKRLFRWGAEEDLIPKDPFAKLTIPPCGKRERVLKRAELRLLYLSTNREFRRLLFVQLHTLARPGEVRQLTWGQIDWQNRVIVLTKFKAQKRRKDKAKARPIPLSKPVLRMLQNMHRKSPDKSPEGRVFRSTRYGQPWTPNSVRCAMREARKRAGLDNGGERIVCYSLRHTGATEAIRSNVNIKVVAEMLGHTRTTTTERYLHLDTSDIVAGIDQVRFNRGRGARSGSAPAGSSPNTSA